MIGSAVREVEDLGFAEGERRDDSQLGGLGFTCSQYLV